MEKKNVIWRRLDNTAKIFPLIASQDLSNVFRISATLKREIQPDLLQQALEEVLPERKDFQVKLRRGVFWYYFEENTRTPKVQRETSYPCKYIDPHGNQKFLFRVTYYQRRINLEVFHALTDGLGSTTFIKQLIYRYLQLEASRREGGESPELDHSGTDFARGFSLIPEVNVEDGYLKHYKEIHKGNYSSRPAFRLTGNYLPWRTSQVIHGYISLPELKTVCKSYGVSITKYLVAVLIWSIHQEYLNGGTCEEPIAVNLPVNLRTFFPSETTANFFAVTTIGFLAKHPDAGFEDILRMVDKQMDKKIVKERLEESISYNVSNEKKWYIRATPLFIKWAVLNIVFAMKSRAHSITLSNVGPIPVEEEYRDEIERFHIMLGVSRRQPLKCVVCAYGDEVVLSFTSVFGDHRLQKRFFNRIRQEGAQVRIEGNSLSGLKKQDMYPHLHKVLVIRQGGTAKASRIVRKVGRGGKNAARGLADYTVGRRDLVKELERRFHL